MNQLNSERDKLHECIEKLAAEKDMEIKVLQEERDEIEVKLE